MPAQFKAGRLAAPRELALPPGFKANVYANGVTSARFMAVGPNGDVYATGMDVGKVFVMPDRNKDGVADEVGVWADGLDLPHGITIHDGYLYVGEHGRVVRFKMGPGGERRSGPEVVVPDLPTGSVRTSHHTRTVGFAPDGKLFVAVGSDCNVCVEQDPRRAAISVFNPDGTGGRVFATGLRNAVGFVWRPGTNELWATNNGRDYLGDDQPPETIYQLHDGSNGGWPYCHAGVLPDPEFKKADQCAGVDKPAVTLPAHQAPLGLRFYDGAMLPAPYKGGLFVALHGSWNRSAPIGYKVVFVPFADGKPGQPQDFATGFLPSNGARGSVWARPVDVGVAPDGALLVSDDDGGAIFRISYAASA